MVGAVKGPLVKGLPYSADEITETTPGAGRRHAHSPREQGHRLSRQRRAHAPRNAGQRHHQRSGRGHDYVINPKTNSVRKLRMSNTMIYRAQPAGPGARAGLHGRGGQDLHVLSAHHRRRPGQHRGQRAAAGSKGGGGVDRQGQGGGPCRVEARGRREWSQVVVAGGIAAARGGTFTAPPPVRSGWKIRDEGEGRIARQEEYRRRNRRRHAQRGDHRNRGDRQRPADPDRQRNTGTAKSCG